MFLGQFPSNAEFPLPENLVKKFQCERDPVLSLKKNKSGRNLRIDPKQGPGLTGLAGRKTQKTKG